MCQFAYRPFQLSGAAIECGLAALTVKWSDLHSDVQESKFLVRC